MIDLEAHSFREWSVSILLQEMDVLLQVTAAAQHKRARTRITDDQLKILRAHFDINNSPSEEQIHEMAGQSGLPPKVIKHWFRNTLFKERQRNKDSPYNFNNPPSTTLNLEEYEKTGEAKVTHLNAASSEEQSPKPPPSPNKRKAPTPQQTPQLPPESIKTEPREASPQASDGHFSSVFSSEASPELKVKDERDTADKPLCSQGDAPLPPRASSPGSLTLTSIIASQLGSDSIVTTHPALSVATCNTINSLSMSSQMSNANNMLPPKLTPPNFASPSQVPTSPGILPLTPVSRSLSPGRSYSSNSSDGFSHVSLAGGNSNGGSSSGGSSGKRANRTRFTDYQIKVLQEFFENNAYPKDDDLEYLSKLLNLSPRVIVVWFQNARQKARKVYENQPPVETPPGVDDGGANRFQRTPGLNYQCKKCLLVFQRYYELIRHQKTHCFKEEDAKRSAQAQAAAAQIAAVLSSEDSNSSTIADSSQHQQQQVQVQQHQQQQVQQQMQSMAAAVPPAMSGSASATSGVVTPTPASVLYPPSPLSSTSISTDNNNKEGTFQCDKCNLVFPRFDLWREHQLVHIMNPNLFPSYPPDSPFGILQQHAQIQQQQQIAAGLGVSDLSVNSTSPHQHPLSTMMAASKRKFDEYDEGTDRDSDQPKDKRLRTTILPEQLDYLYQKYQLESNPSRKMLENIAREVGLKKRVVQVWFQNTRARERKGQFRAHAQVINKRCPFCPALFKVKSALESHLVTKHADQCTRGEINIDALPDEELSMESTPSFNSSPMGESGNKMTSNYGSNSQAPNMMPPLFPPFQADMENSLKKYYEESMKRYLSELQAHHTAQQNGSIAGGKESPGGGNGSGNGGGAPTDLSMKIKQEPAHVTEGAGSGLATDLSLKMKQEPMTLTAEGGGVGDCPLDLSKPVDLSRPMKISMEHGGILSEVGPLTDLSERSMWFEYDSMSETTENMDGDESNPTSPASSTQSTHQRNMGGGGGGGKRFRTQMSSLQVKAMKSLFGDYKTPTMAECEMLGREIGLPKRVVQVWFQNARAKEKKNKLALQKALGSDSNVPPPTTTPERPPEECRLCQFKYSHKYSVQDHIFTKKHIDNVKAYIESGKADASGNLSDGSGAEFTVPQVPGSSSGVAAATADSTTSPQQQQQFANMNQLAQLQMLQMAGLCKTEPGKDNDEMALFHQLYGLGLAGFPPQGNLFLHPAMFSAAGE